MTYMIEADGLAKRFGSTQALRGIDLRAERGSVLALLGPNGRARPQRSGRGVPDADRASRREPGRSDESLIDDDGRAA